MLRGIWRPLTGISGWAVCSIPGIPLIPLVNHGSTIPIDSFGLVSFILEHIMNK
jgi:hypothetical protein